MLRGGEIFIERAKNPDHLARIVRRWEAVKGRKTRVFVIPTSLRVYLVFHRRAMDQVYMPAQDFIALHELHRQEAA